MNNGKKIEKTWVQIHHNFVYENFDSQGNPNYTIFIPDSCEIDGDSLQGRFFYVPYVNVNNTNPKLMNVPIMINRPIKLYKKECDPVYVDGMELKKAIEEGRRKYLKDRAKQPVRKEHADNNSDEGALDPPTQDSNIEIMEEQENEISMHQSVRMGP